MRHWYVVHRQGKRLSAAAETFKLFMLKEAGSPLAQSTRQTGRQTKRG